MGIGRRQPPDCCPSVLIGSQLECGLRPAVMCSFERVAQINRDGWYNHADSQCLTFTLLGNTS